MAVSSLLAGAPALAQTLPPAASQVPQGSPIPRILPPKPPAVAPGAALPALPPPGVAVPNRPVRVSSVAVEGVTAYPAGSFAHDLQGLTGPAVPLPKINAARQAILQQYRSDGYVLTTVSASLDAAGKLRFIVTEGRIASVKLDGNIGPAGTQVLRFLHRLTQQTPINAATLERYLLLAQDVPGVTLRAVLEPSADVPGALNLIAQVSRKPISGLLTFDNRAFDQTGPIEGLGVVDFNSFTEFGEKTEVSWYHTFPNSQNFGQLSEEFYLGGSGLKLHLYAGTGLAIPTGGGTGGLGLLDYHGRTNVFGGTLSYPVIRARQQTLNVYIAFDAIESMIRTNTGSGGLSEASSDQLRVLRLGEDYARSDILFGAERAAVNAVSFRVSHGLHGLGADGNDADGSRLAPRVNEQTDFTKLNFEFSRTQTLFNPWQGGSVALMGLVAGQWSGDILPPAEQFYLGGGRFTRGYYAGQVAGDKALAATAELQLNTDLNLTKWHIPRDLATQFYLFYDWGETWQNAPDIQPVVIGSA
ncbi:MAG TPA: ShlB/FhaC/HecB family hemolysin secretion/activation protein, partial [Acetobacteraceae bacterium]|nr:ShlB/FhaC/HecB family hemolysin secretion/activation protein [Acetobacteraceae bacterium]